MDDEMIDLMAGEAGLRRRLEAYADQRLSPDQASAARTRARVLAIAHRRADQARATGALTIVPSPGSDGIQVAIPTRGRAGRKVAAVLLAASLGLGTMTGTALAARPAGALYETRLWVETLTLPSDPSARALAELGRLSERLLEIDTAMRSGDGAAAAAALAAYEGIVEQASAAAIASEDAVAEAVLETGIGRNVAVLESLVGQVPTPAGEAISRAIERTISHSGGAIDAIGTAKPGNGNGGGNGNGNGGGGPATASPKPTKAPTSEPTAKPTKPVTDPTPKPTPKGGSKPDRPDPTPGRTPKGP